MKKTTMRDIAKAAGVSVMTVSYALKRNPRISRETTERILALVREMNYTMHPLVSILAGEIRAGRNIAAPPVIGYIASYQQKSTWWNHHLHREYYCGAEARSRELGFGFELFELAKYGMSGRELSRVMRYRKICGIVIAAMPTPGMTLDLDWDAFPAVAFGHSMPKPSIHRITLNHHLSMQQALQRVTALGYRRVGVVSSRMTNRRIGGMFLAGVDAWNREGGPKHPKVSILVMNRPSPRRFLKWVEEDELDLVFDDKPMSCYQLLQEAGLRIPEDISYATLGWTPKTPEWAGLYQNPFQTGVTAVDVLAQQIHGNRRGVPELQCFTLVNGSWIDGPSAPNLRTHPGMKAP